MADVDEAEPALERVASAARTALLPHAGAEREVADRWLSALPGRPWAPALLLRLVIDTADAEPNVSFVAAALLHRAMACRAMLMDAQAAEEAAGVLAPLAARVAERAVAGKLLHTLSLLLAIQLRHRCAKDALARAGLAHLPPAMALCVLEQAALHEREVGAAALREAAPAVLSAVENMLAAPAAPGVPGVTAADSVAAALQCGAAWAAHGLSLGAWAGSAAASAVLQALASLAHCAAAANLLAAAAAVPGTRAEVEAEAEAAAAGRGGGRTNAFVVIALWQALPTALAATSSHAGGGSSADWLALANAAAALLALAPSAMFHPPAASGAPLSQQTLPAVLLRVVREGTLPAAALALHGVAAALAFATPLPASASAPSASAGATDPAAAAAADTVTATALSDLARAALSAALQRWMLPPRFEAWREEAAEEVVTYRRGEAREAVALCARALGGREFADLLAAAAHQAAPALVGAAAAGDASAPPPWGEASAAAVAACGEAALRCVEAVASALEAAQAEVAPQRSALRLASAMARPVPGSAASPTAGCQAGGAPLLQLLRLVYGCGAGALRLCMQPAHTHTPSAPLVAALAAACARALGGLAHWLQRAAGGSDAALAGAAASLLPVAFSLLATGLHCPQGAVAHDFALALRTGTDGCAEWLGTAAAVAPLVQPVAELAEALVRTSPSSEDAEAMLEAAGSGAAAASLAAQRCSLAMEGVCRCVTRVAVRGEAPAAQAMAQQLLASPLRPLQPLLHALPALLAGAASRDAVHTCLRVAAGCHVWAAASRALTAAAATAEVVVAAAASAVPPLLAALPALAAAAAAPPSSKQPHSVGAAAAAAAEAACDTLTTLARCLLERFAPLLPSTAEAVAALFASTGWAPALRCGRALVETQARQEAAAAPLQSLARALCVATCERVQERGAEECAPLVVETLALLHCHLVLRPQQAVASPAFPLALQLAAHCVSAPASGPLSAAALLLAHAAAMPFRARDEAPPALQAELGRQGRGLVAALLAGALAAAAEEQVPRLADALAPLLQLLAAQRAPCGDWVRAALEAQGGGAGALSTADRACVARVLARPPEVRGAGGQLDLAAMARFRSFVVTAGKVARGQLPSEALQAAASAVGM